MDPIYLAHPDTHTQKVPEYYSCVQNKTSNKFSKSKDLTVLIFLFN